MATAPKAIDNDALIESSFRRLLAAIESEREKIRSTWKEVEVDRDNQCQELERLRADTMEWCHREKQKIEAEWKRIEELDSKMMVLRMEDQTVLEVNCSGQFFSLPRGCLASVKESYLTNMFSDAYLSSMPKDSQGRYLLDFNPTCFGLIVEWLLNKRHQPDAPTPFVPLEQQANMDMLAESLRLTAFQRKNRVSPVHTTSLLVKENTIEASHTGWQVIATQFPLSTATNSYFEVKVLANPDPRGGMAIGICNHMPQASEIHSIRLANSILYNSNNGIMGDAYGAEDVTKGLQLAEGATMGVKFECETKRLLWYFNRKPVGVTEFLLDKMDEMRTLFPVFCLYQAEQKLSVKLDGTAPSGCPPSALEFTG